MKLTTRCDVQAPLDFTYRCLVDFGAWEQAARRRNVEVERPAGLPLTGVGASWRVRFAFRGKTRRATIRVADLTPDQKAAFALDSPALEGEVDVDLQRLSPRHTRLRLIITLKPKTLAARLLLNTARLAKGRITGKLDQRMDQLGADIEARYTRSQQAAQV